ncbi:MAG: cytochrome c [Myxococcota bacterium]|nr:cytochrome c [Myxococcota bacterium]
MSARALLVICTLAALFSACDESQVWHRPDWSLSRMQEQPRVDPYDPQMSAPPPFTVALGDGVDAPRPRVTRAVVARGRVYFERICAACHGIRGDGVSVVATKMLLRLPPSMLEPRVRSLSDEQLREVIERGYGLMPPYANELTPDDRWATVAYVRALEIAQGVDVTVLPPEVALDVRREAP